MVLGSSLVLGHFSPPLLLRLPQQLRDIAGTQVAKPQDLAPTGLLGPSVGCFGFAKVFRGGRGLAKGPKEGGEL